MNLQIQWTPTALQSLSEVLDYTYGQFGERQLRKLTRQIHTSARRVSIFPLLGKRETKLINATGIDYHSTVVIKQIKLIYTVDKDILYVRFIKNNRMDDSTLLKKLQYDR